MLAALTSDRFRGAASFSGTANQLLVSENMPELAVYDASDPRETWVRSAEAYATSFKCPARLYYGTEEWFMTPSLERTAQRAQQKGLDVELEQVPGEHYTMLRPAISSSIQFFKQRMKTGGHPVAVEGKPQRPSVSGNMSLAPPQNVRRDQFAGQTQPGQRPDPASVQPPCVIYQMAGYSGSDDPTTAARRALRSVPWADANRIAVDQQAGQIIVGVRSRSVSTDLGKIQLRRAGFQIGGVSYHSR
jgi:hypothetical protein